MNVTKLAVAALCAAGLGVLPSAAQATPGTGVSATVLATGTMADGFELTTHGPADFVVQRVTIEPGGSTGWHYHPGTVLAVVHSGTITRIDAHCKAVSYAAGQSLVEAGGADHVHIGRNLGTEPAELYLTYVIAVGDELSVDAPAPGCADITGAHPGGNTP
jgi:quercetin dioxygenase-like cupin family protein